MGVTRFFKGFKSLTDRRIRVEKKKIQDAIHFFELKFSKFHFMPFQFSFL